MAAAGGCASPFEPPARRLLSSLTTLTTLTTLTPTTSEALRREGSERRPPEWHQTTFLPSASFVCEPFCGVSSRSISIAQPFDRCPLDDDDDDEEQVKMKFAKLSAILLAALAALAGCQGQRQQQVADDGAGLARARRQIFQGPALPPAGSQQPLMGAQQPGSFLDDLSRGLEQATTFSKMFNSFQGQPQATAQGGGSGALNAASLMSQLTELIRTSQERTAKSVEATQRSADAAGAQTASAARQAQGGIQSALSEIGAGLQRLAANNPNLLPDIKSLYQSVSSKLSSASTSVAQAASPLAPKSQEQQLAEQLGKAIANPSAK